MKKSSKIITIRDFHAVKLNNKRDIYVYLPQSYDTDSNKRYPVLYMHDGQYAFEPSKNTGSSWNIHKAADRLAAGGRMEEIIIVAVPNMSAARVSEYVHYDISFSRSMNLQPTGLLYEDFLVNDLKPYIDATFRTLTDSGNTALAGSSMGGFVTYNLGLRRPDVFGNLAIMSPFFVYVDPDTLEELRDYKVYKGKHPIKIWIDIGEVEGLLLDKHVREVIEALTKESYKAGKDICYYCVPGGAHFEKDWAERIHAPLLYFFGDIGKAEAVQMYGRDIVGLKGMKAYTNPVVKYDSGFIMSDINGEYVIDHPDVLEVKRDGLIIPKKEGTTKVTFASHGLKASKIYTVIGELPETVILNIKVRVPENTPDDARITMSFLELKKIEKGIYGGKFTLPRDCAFAFKVSIGVGFENPIVEQDMDRNDMEYRRIKVTDDMELNLEVANWKGIF